MPKLLITLGIICILIAGFLALNSYIYYEKQQQSPGTITTYRATLTGEYVCLPHTDTTGPQTLECMYGIKTDVGEYYAVNLNLMSQEHPVLKIGDRFTANGTITPIEMLSTDQWKKYPVEGIFSVTDSVKKQ